MKTKLTKPVIELIIIAFILLLSFVCFSRWDVLEKLVELSHQYEELEIDELLSTLMVLAFCMLWFSFRRWREMRKANAELQLALLEIKQLEGIIPICMYCKEIRDDKGSWNQLEEYIARHSDAQFSHSICDKCAQKHHPEEIG